MPNTILKRWNGSSFEELYPKTTVGQISASGTPDSTTFLRGDGQWVVISGGGGGTVTSVSGTSPIASSGGTTPVISVASGFTIPTSTEKTNYDSAYTHSQVTTGVVHGATTVGNSFFRLTNPSAITFPRINADNTVTTRSASDFRTDIGAGTGNGDVVGPASSTTGNIPRFNDTTGKVLNGGLGIADSTSATALSLSNGNLATERDIYYGTPTINNSKAYTSGTTIWAPTSNGSSGQALVSAGGTTAPSFGTLGVAGGGTGLTTLTAANRLLVSTGTTGLTTIVAGLARQVLIGNASAAPSFGYLGAGLPTADAVVSSTGNTWTTAFELSLPEGIYQINFDGAWERTNSSAPNTFQFSANFNQSSFARIVGSGFYAIADNSTTFTNFHLNHDSSTDGVSGSGFSTTSATTLTTYGRINFSAMVYSIGTNTLRIRIMSSVGSATRLKYGSGFSAIRVG